MIVLVLYRQVRYKGNIYMDQARRKMPKALSKEVKELINYIETELDAGGPLLPLTAVREVMYN